MIQNNFEQPQFNNEIKVTSKIEKNIEDIKISIGGSFYSCYFVDGVIYDGLMKVPEKDRRNGFQKMIEIAKERGVNKIIHHFQSLEGLILISKKLKMNEREYYDNKGLKVEFEEAKEILTAKKQSDNKDNLAIFISSTTFVNSLNPANLD